MNIERQKEMETNWFFNLLAVWQYAYFAEPLFIQSSAIDLNDLQVCLAVTAQVQPQFQQPELVM